jgi:hypothetical protein
VSNSVIPFHVYNAGGRTLRLIPNQGRPVTISGASAAQGWAPQGAELPCSPSWPEPGRLGMGRNSLQVIAEDKSLDVLLMIDLPNHIRLEALQLYLLPDVSSMSWTLLNNGQLISSGRT